MGEIRADIVEEARRLLELASSEGVPLRVLGGVAIRLRAPGELPAALTRTYADLDFVTAKDSSGAAQGLLRGAGYEPHVAFNALHETERLLLFDYENERQVDVFVGDFAMSHKVPVAERLELEPATLPVAELPFSKLQIEPNENDVCDALALFHGHPVDERDGDAINSARIAELRCIDRAPDAAPSGSLEVLPSDPRRLPDRFLRPRAGADRARGRRGIRPVADEPLFDPTMSRLRDVAPAAA